MDEQNYVVVMRNFIICILHQILLW